jgi:hypothetical protein
MLFSFPQHIFRLSISKVKGKWFWRSLKTSTRGEERNPSRETEKDHEQATKQTKYDCLNNLAQLQIKYTSTFSDVEHSFSFAVKKDTAAELAKKREQERQRQEKLAETSRLSRYRRRSRSRSYSRSPPRYFIIPCIF